MRNDIGERISQVIDALHIKKVKFAQQINVDQSYITKLTSGKGKPSARLISSICDKFNVNEHWLSTGEGEMFNETTQSVIEQLCAELKTSELESAILHSYFKLDPAIRHPLIETIMNEVNAEYNKAKSHLTLDNVMDELAALRQENMKLSAKIAAIEEEEVNDQNLGNTG